MVEYAHGETINLLQKAGMAGLMTFTIVICTHNRAQLLKKTLDSINAAIKDDCIIDLMVVLNACTDNSCAILENYIDQAHARGWLPLRWLDEPRPGKSYALNTAIQAIDSPVIVFVDDDHRVDSKYLANVCKAISQYPDATIFCGRIFPDWDGFEPVWAHEDGEFAVYPLPVPRYDQGEKSRIIGREGPYPGGGNLIVKRDVFERVGNFSTRLGPHGHDLGGGEDSDLVMRAVNAGEVIRYVPEIVQYHYVDPERFSLPYILQKSYQRSRSVTRIRNSPQLFPPRFLWRKLAGYLLRATVSLYWPEKRFYMIRTAATLGEISGYFSARLPHKHA